MIMAFFLSRVAGSVDTTGNGSMVFIVEWENCCIANVVLLLFECVTDVIDALRVKKCIEQADLVAN